MNYKLILAYEGTSYAGWQKTKEGPSIEALLQQKLETLLQHPISLQAASRTDAGVHSEGQVVNFFTQKPMNERTLKHRLNGLLPKTIAVLSAEQVPVEFHPTMDAIKKEYWYHICNRLTQSPFQRHTSWHFPYPLDSQAMRSAAKALLGSHDFSAFCNERRLWDRSPICCIESIEIEESGCLRIKIIGDHFLYKMARTIAGTLVYVGCGKLEASQIPDILNSKDRTQSGVTAPAHGLILKRVFYHEINN